ncbi:mitochondrial carrier protein LEU5 [Schizothecium vesticola]|uniref:Mitochondrial thiamine pyrophosphate carrier 1 n=1 Tax=Schizothecium vesticola TaxID=314040 RepID=A0AA40K9K7_9PEZI|nr:mitochondrial carrier protein LEU5 [Schizothecium vesticola]
MPGAILSHASMPSVTPRESRHEARDALPSPHRPQAPAVWPTDDEAAQHQGKVTTAKDRKSLDYIWRSGVAGGVAGCAAKTMVAPLDRVKILFQAHNPQFIRYAGSWFGVGEAIKAIYQQDGPVGLFRGHSATLLRIFPYAAIKFLAYEQIRAAIIHKKEHETPLRRLLSGSLAGVTSVFFTYPLEVIRVRLAFETKKDSRSSMRAICNQIYHEQARSKPPLAVSSSASGPASIATPVASAILPRSGLTNFYRGFAPTLLGMFPYAGMSFLTHDTVGDILRHPSLSKWTTLPQPENAQPGKAVPLRSWAELLAGGIAGLISQTTSYPLEVIRRRMQVGGAVGDGHRLRIGETARIIMKERGARGFFVGLTIGYVKVVPMAAVAFYTYERMKTLLGI